MNSNTDSTNVDSKQAQVPKTNINNGTNAMLVGCGYKDEMIV